MALTPEQIAAMDQALQGGLDADTMAQMDAAVAAPVAKRGIGRELLRQGGLTARYATEGLLAIPAMVANIPAGLYNEGADLIQGEGVGYRFPEQNAAVSQALTSIGLPNPENATERVVGDASRSLVGLGGVNSLAKTAPMYINKALTSNIGTQAASAITGAVSGGVTRELGGGPGAQLAASLAGGILPVAGYQVVTRGLKDTARAVSTATEPLTEKGQRQIVGRLMTENADDAQRAAQNLKDIPEYVPGSPVTTGEAAGDAGLAAMQRGLRNQAGNPFADIESQQNAARNRAFDIVARDKDLAALDKVNRDAVTAPLREKAFAGKRNVLPKEPLDEIMKIRKSPVGKRDSVNAAMMWAQKKILAVKDPEELYAIRQDINDAMQGKFDSDKPALRLAKSQLKQVKDALDNTIERGAPGFKQYVEKYAELSKPINQQEIMMDVRNRVSMAGSPDIKTGYDFLSQPKMSGILRDETGELARNLSPEQLQVLGNISKDMERSASLNARNVRALGSDTAQNINAQAMVGDFLAQRAADRLPLGLGKIIQTMGKEKVNVLLTEAFKDPKLARQLLIELRPELKNTPYSGAMTQKLLAQTIGSLTAAEAQK